VCLALTECQRYRRWLDFDAVLCSSSVLQCPATGISRKGVNEVMAVVTALQRHVTAVGAVTSGPNEILRVFCTFFSGLGTVWYM